MYFIIYSFCYLFSLLPWRVMYWIGDFVAFVLHRIVKYRLDVVRKNLTIAKQNRARKKKNRK